MPGSSALIWAKSNVLSIRNLGVRYGAVEVLKGIDLEIAAGEITAIVGANGAGKTTLLRTISGLIRPERGSIAFEGTELVGMPSHEIVRRGLIQVPEGRMILAKLTVTENLLVAAAFRRDREHIAYELDRVMDRFAILRERAGYLAGTLSGGQQQMLAIGRALLARPKLLLLDEPSLGLAPVISQQVFAIIGEICREGVTVMLIEQNARRALQISSRAYVIELGRLTVQGTGRDVLANPEVIKAYLGG
jgi:branched-chain amino acid transport system ATP-binding protein